MSFIGQQLLVPHLGKQTYSQKVRSIFGSSLIAYWMLGEAAGAVADNYEGTAARDGTYTGVTLGQTGIGDGRTCPLFDGANDFANIYSASMATAFSPAAGTISAWAKVANAAVWADGANRAVAYFMTNDFNRVRIIKTVAANSLTFAYTAGATLLTVVDTSAPTNWFHVALTWSVLANEMKAYLNGTQIGTTQAGFGVWVGDLAATSVNIGAQLTAPTATWNGYIAHVALGNTALSPTNVAKLAVV